MSPQGQARTAGVLALLTVPSGLAAVALGNLIVPGDAATTAHNLLTHELMLRLVVVGDVVSVLYVPYTLLLFVLFTPVSRNLSLLAAMFSLIGIAIGTVNVIFELGPLVILSGRHSFAAFTAGQLDALALMLLMFHAQVSDLSLVLFGTYNVLIGYLIVRSRLMPSILGVLLAFAGLCYEINNFATFLAPQFAAHLIPYILLPGLSEILVALWLAFFGINLRHWGAVVTSRP